MSLSMLLNRFAVLTACIVLAGCGPQETVSETVNGEAAPAEESVAEMAAPVEEAAPAEAPAVAPMEAAETDVSVTVESGPYGGAPHAIPGLIEMEHYDEGPAGVAYSDLDEENQGVPYRENTQVDIEGRDDASNGHGVGWARGGEWLNYTVNVAKTGNYTVEFPVASNKKGGVFHLEVNGVDISGPIDVPDTGAWTTLEMITAENVKLASGVQTIRVVMDTSGESGATGDIDYMKFTLVE